MVSKREVEELILTMADVVIEKRHLEEENRMLKEMFKERDEMINEHLERTHKDTVMVLSTVLERSMKNIDELLQEVQEDRNNTDDIFLQRKKIKLDLR